MKVFYHVLLILLIITCSLWGQSHDVVLSFISESGWSNNLFIDNVNVGTQFSSDVAVASLNNIAPDTSYAMDSSDIIISPNVSVINVGGNDISTSFDVVMTVSPTGYLSTKPVASLSSGSAADITFDPLTITPGNPIDITIYSLLPGDENTANDTLYQYTLIFPGIHRNNVLLQQWTSSTCGPCASNNPTIDAFVESNFDSVVAVKYHVWWPNPGNDPMYLYNTEQIQYRTSYYGVSGVPNVIMGGVYNPVYPYTTPGSLQDGYDTQMSKGTPIEITVNDSLISGDSIQTDVAITIHAPLRAGDYVLQIEAIERLISYSTAPGTNGETDFYDVFRRAYPDVYGTPMPTSIGTHEFVFKYAIDTTNCVDSLIYTIAYVQDNNTKDIWGSDKGNTIITTKDNNNVKNSASSLSISKPVPNPDITKNDNYSIIEGLFLGGFNYELFEGAFPPNGWRVINPDDRITFEKYEGVNGTSFAGNSSVFIDFFSYSTIGAKDTMYTRVYTDISYADSIKFDYAHAEYPNYGPDRLIVKLSVDGGLTFPHTIFDKSGSNLATAPDDQGYFEPTAAQWETFSTSVNEIVNSIPERKSIITDYKLEQNYPNPFNPGTHISYSLPGKSIVNLKVYNTLGQEVRTLVNNVSQPAENYRVYWDGKDNNGNNVSSGVYYYTIVSKTKNEEYKQSKKMLLIK